MTSKDFVLESMRQQGKLLATDLQTRATDMTATEIVAEEDYIPTFSKAILVKNMLERSAGFLVKTTLGNVCKLLTPYDSAIYTAVPEEYPSMWGFQWSQDPAKAKAFVAISTSPYLTGDCCVGSDGVTYVSTIDNNVFDPVESPQYWEVTEND